MDVFLDELVVRRELAINFCLNNPAYDAYEGVPEWARRTLATHATDHRSFVYTLEQFERCATLTRCGAGAEGAGRLREAAQLPPHVLGQEDARVVGRSQRGVVLGSPTSTTSTAWTAGTPSSYTGVGWCWGLHDREFPEGGGDGNGAEDVGGWHAVQV